ALVRGAGQDDGLAAAAWGGGRAAVPPLRLCLRAAGLAPPDRPTEPAGRGGGRAFCRGGGVRQRTAGSSPRSFPRVRGGAVGGGQAGVRGGGRGSCGDGL